MKRKVFSFITALLISSAVSASDLQLEYVWVPGSSNLYLTYMSIGVLADSHTKQLYDNAQTISFVQSVVAQAGVQKNYLEKLSATSDISSADRVFLKKMVDCYVLLMDEGKYLIDYVKTGKVESLKQYDDKRQQAWALINELFAASK